MRFKTFSITVLAISAIAAVCFQGNAVVAGLLMLPGADSILATSEKYFGDSGEFIVSLITLYSLYFIVAFGSIILIGRACSNSELQSDAEKIVSCIERIAQAIDRGQEKINEFEARINRDGLYYLKRNEINLIANAKTIIIGLENRFNELIKLYDAYSEASIYEATLLLEDPICYSSNCVDSVLDSSATYRMKKLTPGEAIAKLTLLMDEIEDGIASLALEVKGILNDQKVAEKKAA